MSTRFLAFILVAIWAVLTVSVPYFVLKEPFEMPSREGSLHSSFESDLEGWHGENLSWTNSDSRHGSASLKLAWQNGSENTVFAPRLDSTIRIKSVICEIKLRSATPAHASLSMKPVLFFKNKDGDWYQTIGSPLYPGRWRLYRFDVSGSSLEMQPVHLGGAWNGQAARECDIWGLGFASSGLESAEVFLDNIRFVLEEPERQLLYAVNPGPRELDVFDLYEIEFEVHPEPTNPFDPSSADIQASITRPDGETDRIPAFYYRPYRRSLLAAEEHLTPDGPGQWRVRYTPRYSGTYSLEIEGMVEGRQISAGPFEFTARNGDHPGFISVSEDNSRFFAYENGEWFYPVGHNFRSPTDTRTARMLDEVTPPDIGTFKYDEVLPKMARNGENSFEVWMASWFAEIEWTSEWKNYRGLGRYNLANAWRLDYVLELARKLGLKVHLVIDNHGQISSFCDDEWKYSPYNVLNGGPVRLPEEFWSNREVIEQYKKKIRYIIARWGYSPDIMGIEMISELDLTGSRHGTYKSPAVHQWHQEIAGYIDKLDVNDHLLTTHFSTKYTTIDFGLVRRDFIDYIVGDAYHSGESVTDLVLKTDANIIYKGGGKPYFMTEYGGSPFGNSVPALEADLHCGIWSSYMTHSAGTPYFWWFDLIEREDWYSHFKALAAFHKGEDRLRAGRLSRRASTTSNSRVRSLAYGSDERGYAWVYHYKTLRKLQRSARDKNAGVVLYITGLRGEEYSYEAWDTFTGEIVAQGDATIEKQRGISRLRIKLPTFTSDIAIKYFEKK